jgi:hypothetical protein
LRPKKGEFTALKQLGDPVARRTVPLFDIDRVNSTVLERKYLKNSDRPLITYLDRVLDQIAVAWKRNSMMIDAYQWSADQRVENGDHLMSYVINGLRSRGLAIIPVVGYDRWPDAAYRAALQSIAPPTNGHYCLRLDPSAIEDSADPDHFDSVLEEIVADLSLDPPQCTALIDFGDIAGNARSLSTLIAQAEDIVRQLGQFHFGNYVIAGCSLPPSIDLAVAKRDSDGSILRKELLVWQDLRTTFSEQSIICGDYGARGPTTVDTPSKYMNGKIRYTIDKQHFIVRGHAFYNDNYSRQQMFDLAERVVASSHFLGEGYSWGDQQILSSSRRSFVGGPAEWIAVDTNHHVTFVVDEIEAFESSLAMKSTRRNPVV